VGPLRVWLAKDVICVAAYGHASDQAWYVMPSGPGEDGPLEQRSLRLAKISSD